MKRLAIAVLATLLVGAIGSRADTTNVIGVATNVLGTVVTDLVQTSVTDNVAITFKGTVVGLDGKTVSQPSTSDLGDTNVSVATLQIVAGPETNTTTEIVTTNEVIVTGDGTNTFTVATTNDVLTIGETTTKELSAIVGSLVTTNEVPIGGGSNVLVVVKQAKILLVAATSVVTTGDKIWAIYEGEVGTNSPGVVQRQLLFTGSVKTDKISVKTQGVWVDGQTALKSGTIKNAK